MISPAANDANPPSSADERWADELGAALDTAACSLEELFERGGELSLDLDARSGRLRILLDDRDGRRRLTPSELFELLGGDAL